MKRLFCLLFVCILNAITFAQSVDDAVYCTEVTYEIKNYKDNWYTPLMYLCQDTKTKSIIIFQIMKMTLIYVLYSTWVILKIRKSYTRK